MDAKWYDRDYATLLRRCRALHDLRGTRLLAESWRDQAFDWRTGVSHGPLPDQPNRLKVRRGD